MIATFRIFHLCASLAMVAILITGLVIIVRRRRARERTRLRSMLTGPYRRGRK